MLENPKQNGGIEYGLDAREPQTKLRDRIRARCWRLRNKRMGSNLGAMLENPNQKERIKSRRDAREPEIKKEGIESGHNAREPESKGRD